MNKGHLVKVCADTTCKIHFGDREQEEKQRLQGKVEKAAANRKAKETLAFRHRLLADVLKRVKPHFGTEELRMVAQFVLRSLSHDLTCRLAKRHGLQNPKDANDWQMAEKARTLYKKADAAALAVLIFEAMLISPAGSATVNKDDDPLTDAAILYKVDAKALRTAIGKAEKAKAQNIPIKVAVTGGSLAEVTLTNADGKPVKKFINVAEAMPGSAAYDQTQIDKYYVPDLNDDFVPPASVPVKAYVDGGFARK